MPDKKTTTGAERGIEAVFLTTHNWGKSAKFFQSLGFTLEFETDHQSGRLTKGDGPYLFIAEIPANDPPEAQVVIRVPDEGKVQPGAGVEVLTPFEDTHWGTREMTVRDPDGRVWRLQAPGKAGDQ
ncbi:VOC family protein [Trinickia diaoshuihuensis]|uniref:VOC family protein n=1 Tax=Trinickia diaoshuihuensis TaxID=2292265 RepID=UPI000E21CFCC|nr:VOC family protein [Trinickia diaoshuihuensis]